MGNAAGALGRFVTKKARRFNVESRTESYLEKNVKNPAPKPVATQREIEKLQQEMPDLMEKINKRNEELLTRLKTVYVSSEGLPPDKIKAGVNPNRPLPIQCKSEYLEFGYVEPESVTPGRLTLRQALQLLSRYQLDKEKNSIESLALQYNLSEKDVGNFVDYFKVYTLVENERERGGFDVNPTTILDDPKDKIPINVMTLPEETKRMQGAVQAFSDAATEKASATSENNSKDSSKNN